MSSERGAILTALGLAVAAWLGASQTMPAIDARREALQMTLDPERLKELPPQIAITQAALGSFRGLAVDYLWLRAGRMQDEGRYYEAMELAGWITDLQPRFPSVWAFQAWNMAYNISDAVQTDEEKWLWVQNGIRLLRDKGIPANPHEIRLYHELSMIYFHKLGKFAVGSHWYYKRHFAAEWHELLGAPPEGGQSKALAAMRALAGAPRDFESLAQERPATAAVLKAWWELGLPEHADGVRRIGRVLEFRRFGERGIKAALARETDPQRRAVDERVYAWFAEPRDASAVAEALAFWRALELRRTYRMDPAVMAALTEKFGPLDWRHPAAHSLYWADRGIAAGEAVEHEYDFDMLTADRFILHSLQMLAFGGRVNLDLVNGYYSQSPDVRLFDAFEKALTDAGARKNTGFYSAADFAASHRGFLEWAVPQSYLLSGPAAAEGYYEKLRRAYGSQARGAYAMPLEDFVVRQLTRGQDVIEHVRSTLAMLIQRAILEGWAEGQSETAQRFLRLAKDRIYDHYTREFTTGRLTARGALVLPPFVNLVADGFVQTMLSSPGAVPIPLKARLWERAPAEVRRMVFDRIHEPLYEQSRQAGWSPERAFPEPPGMAEYRSRSSTDDTKPDAGELIPRIERDRNP